MKVQLSNISLNISDDILAQNTKICRGQIDIAKTMSGKIQILGVFDLQEDSVKEEPTESKPNLEEKPLNTHTESVYNNSNEVKELGKKKKKTTNTISSKKKARKIEANFQDADKLYKAYFSECGLVVRTKNKYVNDFCEDCQGQLAEEWKDKKDVKCRYLCGCTEKCCEVEPKAEQEIKQEEKSITKEDIDTMRKTSKINSAELSNKIIKAQKILDGRIKERTEDTVISAVKIPSGQLGKCSKCGQFVKKGFMVDDDFLCKECTVSDFKNYMKRRGK